MEAKAARNGLRYLEDYPKAFTLQEGLREYRRANPHLLKEGNVPEGAAAFFHKHDLCHVVFGCTTSLRDEALADTWTMFGSDISWARYFSYLKQPEVIGILQEVGYWKTLRSSVQAVPAVLSVIFRATQMTKKWPFDDPDQFLDTSLGELRLAFGIRVYPSET